jgi:hypothetical protein
MQSQSSFKNLVECVVNESIVEIRLTGAFVNVDDDHFDALIHALKGNHSEPSFSFRQGF